MFDHDASDLLVKDSRAIRVSTRIGVLGKITGNQSRLWVSRTPGVGKRKNYLRFVHAAVSNHNVLHMRTDKFTKRDHRTRGRGKRGPRAINRVDDHLVC